jgi:murein DD-endopeptidase MepM/ murein hydrolase activator NlpD
MTDSRPAVTEYRYPRLHLLLAILISTALVVALTLLPSPDATATRTVRLAQPLVTAESPAQEALTVADEIEAAVAMEEVADTLDESVAATRESDMAWSVAEVKRGDTLSHIFKRVGLGPKDVQEVLTAKGDLSEFKKIHPGQQVRFGMRDDRLESLEYVISRTESLQVRREADGFVAEMKREDLVPFTSYAEGVITSSLFLAAQKAGLTNSMTMELANIFGYDVDFALDIREGDSFRVIYQELHLDGEKVRDGDILAAQFTNQGKTFTAIRYDTSDRGADYFTPEGMSMRKAFRRSPLDFARISSHFNLARRHPVLHTIRAHKGTDYAASTGTPIKATGDGKVAFAGWKGGYGRVVILTHGQGIQTLYGHMSGFARNIRAGTRVSQGQVIGYVGASGLATGPHLHYEFYVNGSVRNPVTVKLPQAEPVSTKDKPAFMALSAQMQNQLSTYAAAIKSETLARLETE